MGLFMTNQDDRSQLQQRVNDRLRARAAEQRKLDEAKPVDGVEDSAFIEGTRRTTPLALAWVGIIVLALIVFGLFIYWISG